MSHKYSLIHEQSRGKLPQEITSFFKPKLMSCNEGRGRGAVNDEGDVDQNHQFLIHFS